MESMPDRPLAEDAQNNKPRKSGNQKKENEKMSDSNISE